MQAEIGEYIDDVKHAAEKADLNILGDPSAGAERESKRFKKTKNDESESED